MEWEGKIGAPQALCAASGRPLRAGETVFGVLVMREGSFARIDIAAEAWDAWDKAQALSWWRRVVPEADRKAGRIRLDPQAMARIFADLAESTEPAKIAFRYVVALCLVRARKMTMEKVERDDTGTWMILIERGGIRHRLRDPVLRTEDETRLTDELLSVAAATETPRTATDA
ncbi:MAG: hypothetical protein AAB263_00745 [Planctomycetota bacterium]